MTEATGSESESGSGSVSGSGSESGSGSGSASESEEESGYLSIHMHCAQQQTHFLQCKYCVRSELLQR